MGIRLDTPEAKEVAQDQAVTLVRLIVPHERHPDGTMRINKGAVALIASIATYSTEGDLMEAETMQVPMADVPAAGIDLLKQLYSWLENEATDRGLIGSGVAEPLD